MRGSIRSQQTCPECGRRGDYAYHRGRGSEALVCRCGRFIATLLTVVVTWRGKPLWINYDKMGNRLHSYEQARRAQAAITEEIEAGRFLPQLWRGAAHNRLLWRNYVEDYLKREAQRLAGRRATLDKKRALLRHTAWLNEMNIREIRAGHLADLEALPCLRLALSDKTRQDLMAEIRYLLRRACAREDIERVPEVPSVAVVKKAVRWMDVDQQTKVLEKIPQDHRPIFFFLMEYGLRPAEACALCWDCLDLEHGVVVLARTFSRRRLCDGTKQRADNPLPIVNWFADYLAGAPRGIGKTPVFRNPEADPARNPEAFYLPEFLTDLWRRCVAAAGFEPIRLYNATRHSWGTQRSLEGWSREDIARWLGHSGTAHVDKYVDSSRVERLRRKMSVTKAILRGKPLDK